MTVTDATLDAMHQYGGSFVQQLATLYRCADPQNQERLRDAFADYFRHYDDLAHSHARMRED